jgi:hypothetical protein
MKDEILDLLNNSVEKNEIFNDEHELYEHLDYNGGVHEIIDSNIDVYNYDLRKWSVDNYEWIEWAMEEWGFSAGGTDFHKLIQCGQFMALQDKARCIVKHLFKEYSGKLFNIKEIA